MLLFVFCCVATAFWVAFPTTFLVRHLAPRIGLVDHPAARKVHVVPTPLGGGIGIVLGVVLPLAMAHLFVNWLRSHQVDWLPAELAIHVNGAAERASQLWTVVGVGIVLAAVGLMDDFRPLPWLPRLLLQILAGVIVVSAGIRATVFQSNPWIGAILTVIWIVVLINSFNFLDNMDGLSGGIGFIVSAIFAVMMLQAPGDPRWLVAGYFLILAGSLLGFLCHNWSPARIFMGDAGSYFMGFSIATMTILGTFYSSAVGSQHVILAPLCVLAVPLYDITSVIWIRMREGRSPFQPDKRHFSHRLVALGFRPVTAVLVVHLATWTTGLGGLALYRVSDWSGAAIPIAMVLSVVLIIAVLEQSPGPKVNS